MSGAGESKQSNTKLRQRLDLHQQLCGKGTEERMLQAPILYGQLRWPSGKSVCFCLELLDSCLIPSWVKPITLKSLFTASLLDAQH